MRIRGALAQAVAAIAKAKRRKGAPVSPRYRGKRDGDLNNDGRPDRGSLDPKAKDYRYRDTGYVAGSRKEMAALMIRTAAKKGQRLRATDIDWADLEQNPRNAETLITKSHLFGKVDWAALRQSGMEPAAGFLIDRAYAAIGKAPALDTPQGRKDYALGLETLRDRLERARSVDDVTKTLTEIRDEYRGVSLNADEADRVSAIGQRMVALSRERHEIGQADRESYRANVAADAARSRAKYEITKRENRGWKARPEDVERLKAAEDAAEKAHAAWRAKLDEIKPKKDRLEAEYRALHDERRGIEAKALLRNQDQPLNRAWKTLGDRFLAVVDYRGHKGSQAFANHVAAAKAGKVEDWSWAEGDEPKKGPKSTKESTGFQLQVADRYERAGGREIKVDSTADLKSKFALREVQSGNWVLRDVNSAKFHTERAAEGFADLADIIEAPDAEVSLNGRLALALGARGQGGRAAAHYEPVQRVINITKMGGGGSLAHEWFHALDNIVAEMETGAPGKTDDYPTENPDRLPEGEVRDAFKNLRRAMLDGEVRSKRAIPYTSEDLKLARWNMDNPRGAYGLAARVKSAGSVHAAAAAIEDSFAPLIARGKRGAKGQRDRWITLAAAYYGGKEQGGEIEVAAGPKGSSFYAEARALDAGKKKPYWATAKEMGARAFQAYVEDRLAAQGRRNDYLSWRADNKFYAADGWRPFPEGEERERINAAFDRVFAAIRARGTLRKALERYRW